ncbi:hypothetical protein ACFQLX_01430 [Streptomyces polyrhachis]|uniref:DUF732 domain-containing protein n=1 Tax=Streptomyces polyrhachis TaxID=1282885 RepID=A0ABW2GCX9_9ACTN
MRIRAAVLAITTATLLALTGCATDGDAVDSRPEPTPSAVPTASATSIATAKTGIPDAPVGTERAALLAALLAVSPAVVGADEDRTVAAARNQCSAIHGGAKDLDHSAAQRFAQGDTSISDAQGKAINEVLKKTLCP